MSNVTEAVRLALGLHDMQARIAGLNIANANMADARAVKIDFAATQAVLRDGSSTVAQLQQATERLRALSPAATNAPIQADEQVADMVEASLGYQALSETLSRHFGLMRLAATGRS